MRLHACRTPAPEPVRATASRPAGQALQALPAGPAQLLIHFLHATLAGPPFGMLKGVDGVLVPQVSDVQSNVLIVVGPLAFQPGVARPGAS